jgi:hypothetical protein
MSTHFQLPFSNFSGQSSLLTIATGPVILSQDRTRVLLHISSTTQKYQFVGGRLDDTLSFRDNALERAYEVISRENTISLDERDPCIFMDQIDQNGVNKTVLLIHYLAQIRDEVMVGDANWFTLNEVRVLE